MTDERAVREPRTEASVKLRRRLTPVAAECPVSETGLHETYGGICHCGWTYRDDLRGNAREPDRAELTKMLLAIEDEAAAGVGLDVERLAEALDKHWLAQWVESGVAYCTCGEWEFDARSGQHPLPIMGERFLPFSRHVAEALASGTDR
jgi:hypothetical protein